MQLLARTSSCRGVILVPAVFLAGTIAIGPAFGQGSLKDRLRDFQVGEIWIYDDWQSARKLAAKEEKPLFVVFRCVP